MTNVELDVDDCVAYAKAAKDNLLTKEELNPFSYDVTHEEQMEICLDMQTLAYQFMLSVKGLVNQRCLSSQEVAYVSKAVEIVMRSYNTVSDYQ
jgi:hypothetical protein